ncbi:HIT domain-containing protein [Chloroflexota bacterium]
MEYILQDKPEGCLFCMKQQEPRGNDRENHILYRGTGCYMLLNRFPYTSGHVMIAPYQHEASLEQLDDKALHEMIALTQISIATLNKALSPAGFNIGMNLGKVAGAGVADHIHMHVVPRWQGDTDFMSICGETRLIPETLDTTYDKLLPILAAELGEGDSAR